MRTSRSRPRDDEETPFVSLHDITEMELIVLKRMREFTIGEHRGVFHGAGFDFVGLREWVPGDRPSAIDWAQSTITNFSPLIIREFEQPSTAAIVAVADRSLSTRCGIGASSIGMAIARAIATIGMSAVFFQDMFGLITFDEGFRGLAAVRPRIGKNQLIHCLDAYQYQRGLEDIRHAGSISMSLAGFMRKTSIVPVISDFLVERPEELLRELACLNSAHDVFLVLIDSAFAFEIPRASAGWVEMVDVETGRARVLSRAAAGKMARRAAEWQDEVERAAKDLDLDVLRLGIDEQKSTLALIEFVAERRLRKV